MEYIDRVWLKYHLWKIFQAIIPFISLVQQNNSATQNNLAIVYTVNGTRTVYTYSHIQGSLASYIESLCYLIFILSKKRTLRIECKGGRDYRMAPKWTFILMKNDDFYRHLSFNSSCCWCSNVRHPSLMLTLTSRRDR